MNDVPQFLVLPFIGSKGRIRPGERRRADSMERAVHLARAISSRYAGVAAYQVSVDLETGEMHDPVELVRLGAAPALDEGA